MTSLQIVNFSSKDSTVYNFDKTVVTEFFPDVHKDNRGYFFEVLKQRENDELPEWYKNISWIKQINRSCSSRYVIRGCHAQRGKSCQGKLVEAVNHPIYDIITDARPDSESFGVSHIFLLNPETHNQLWVPRGFLHSVVFPDNNIHSDDILLQYFCDNQYDHENEFGVNPLSVIPEVVDKFRELFKYDDIMNERFKPLYDLFDERDKLIFSEKDTKAEDYNKFMSRISSDYSRTGELWYK